MKVCQLCAVDFTLKHFLLPLIDGMRDAGWEVTAVCSDGPAVAGLRERGYDIETVRIERSFNLFRHIGSTRTLVRLFKARHFDVVHVHTPVAALVGRVAARIAGVPTIIYTAHGFYFHDEMPAWKRRIFVWLEKVGAAFTDLLFTQSEEDARTAESERLAPPDRILAIGNGVDPSRFDPERVGDGKAMRRQLGIPDEAFVVGIIARMVQEKGVGEFLQAAVEVAGKNPNVYFLMVGERLSSDHAGNVAGDLERASAVLVGRLIVTGARSDVPVLLAAMDLFCLPSWREGMPRTIIEAMMMGKPVVATNIRGSREEVVSGKTGYLVPTRDPQALAETFLRCAADVGAAREMGAAGRRRALRLYDEHRVVALQIERIGEHLRYSDPATSRICIVMTSPFAYESFIRPHAEWLARDHAVTVCFNRGESSIPVHFPPNVRFVPMPIVRDISPFRDLVALIKVWRFFRREHFDLVFSITPKGGMVAMLAARFAGIPSRIHCFTGQVWATRRGIARLLLRMVDRILALAASGLLADSPSQRRFLIEEGIVMESKIAVLGSGSICGVDVERFKPDIEARDRIRRQYRIAANEICLLFVGRLTTEKGVPDLIEAFRRLVPYHPNLRLMLVGPDEGGMERQWSGVEGLVFVGYTQVVQEYMAAADVLCLPSYREGFGLVLVEAGACGLPVVASHIYGATDAVVDGETGLLHAPGDVNDLTSKLKPLIATPDLCELLSTNGRQRALREFTRDYVVGLYATYLTAHISATRASCNPYSTIGRPR